LTQEEFALRTGVKRTAQVNYENETREPKISYLAALPPIGVNLPYVLFGTRETSDSVSAEDIRKMSEVSLITLMGMWPSIDGQMAADARFALFECLRELTINTFKTGHDIDQSISSLFSIMTGWQSYKAKTITKADT
jgi:transcriptional regulator with XRE-family HTH domain